MPSQKDYYEILGISKNATPEEIKKAYRNLARAHHPDMVKDGEKKAAETRFKEINEAYQILSDPQKKQMYDQYGHAGPGFGSGGRQDPFGGFSGAGGQWGPFSYTYSSGGNQGDFGNVDPFEIFEDFFGFRGFGGQRAPKRGKNLHYEMQISFYESLNGLEKEVNIESGKTKISIPAGVVDGNEIKYAGKGMPGPNGTPAGDLFITVRVSLPKEFSRAGNVLVAVCELDIVTATLGGEIEVPVISLKNQNGIERVKLKIPSGTQYGTNFRLKGKGLPIVHSSVRGDIVVQVIIKVPQKLSRNQKKALEEFMRG